VQGVVALAGQARLFLEDEEMHTSVLRFLKFGEFEKICQF